MDLTLAMRAFVRTVERGSVTAAARDLGVSQPAVSKLLRNLEREVQARLLERNSRSLRPTPQGVRLYQDAAGALASLDAAVEAARDEVCAVQGTLRLHSPVCLGERQVQAIVSAFQDGHPGVCVHLTLENRTVDLVHENLDLAFAIGRPNAEATICRRIGMIRRLLVASPSYLARQGPITEPSGLATHPILATEVALGRKGTLVLHRDGDLVELAVRPALVTNNARVLLDAIVAGRGIGTAQAHMVAQEISDGSLIQVLPGYSLRSSELFLAYPSTKYLRPLVRRFIDFAVSAIGEVRGLQNADPVPLAT